MKKIFCLLALGVCLAAEVRAEDLIASNTSDRYHKPDCKIVEKITPEEKITFRSPEEGAASGYGPCKKCHPLAKVTNLKIKQN